MILRSAFRARASSTSDFSSPRTRPTAAARSRSGVIISRASTPTNPIQLDTAKVDFEKNVLLPPRTWRREQGFPQRYERLWASARRHGVNRVYSGQKDERQGAARFRQFGPRVFIFGARAAATRPDRYISAAQARHHLSARSRTHRFLRRAGGESSSSSRNAAVFWKSRSCSFSRVAP